MSTNPFDLYPMPTFHAPIVVPQFKTTHVEPAPAPAVAEKVSGAGVCPTCGKTFKQLAQHITKSHTKYAVRIVGDRAYMSFNGEPEKEGDMPYVSDEHDEWLWYPDGSESIGVVRTKKTGKTVVWREGHKGKRMYLHNVKITG